VQCGGVHPSWFDGQQGCSQLSTDYHLSFANQGKQTLFSVSVGSKQTEVCHFRFPFAANKWKLPFSVSFIFRKYIYIYMLPYQTENRSPGNFS
jgi:hypothetical protein